MGTELGRLREAVASVREALPADLVPRVGLALGSGLGGFAERIDVTARVPYGRIAGFPVSSVEGHAGRLLFGTLAGVPLVAMDGRVHLYEGYAPANVVAPVRLLGLLGAKAIILTNAAGGVAPALEPGDLMLITDHIATLVPSPLAGPHEPELGPRFPDMSEVYSPRLRALAHDAAREVGVALKEGVYLQMPGPAYETPAEVRMAATLGADAVGMSTAIEAVAAHAMGLEVAGISCITNKAAGLSPAPLSHEEVQAMAARASKDFAALLANLIARLGAPPRAASPS